MINKLKFLTAYFNRAIVPAPGATIGKIFYTKNNTTGRRIQYVIDVDNNTTIKQTINAHPADPLTEPGKIVELSLTSPKTDAMYAYKLASLPTIEVNYDLDTSVATNSPITINLFDTTDIDGVRATALTAVINVIDDTDGITVDGAGDITVAGISVEGVYTITYTISDINEPSVTTGPIVTTVTVVI